MIEVRGLTKRFNGLTAVDDLTLEVAEGEVLGLLGPNGAGKTTTTRMLSCLIAPTSGQATVCGRRVGREDHQIRQLVGVLTESPGHYDSLSAETNLLFYARLHGVSKPARQAEKYLKLLGLWDRRRDPAGSFSKGMKQKLAIARALLHEPRILMLDEPTASLDPEMTRLVRRFVEGLRGEGRTILLCTHDLDEAERLCDRVAVIRTRLIALAKPTDLRSRLFGRKSVVRLREAMPGTVRELLRLAFVADVERNGTVLVIDVDDPARRNPEIVRRLVAFGADIVSVGESKESLEEVYLKLLEAEGRP